MANFSKPEEILYHTQLSRNMLLGADTAILPGDPGRVKTLAEALGPAVELGSHREYTSWLAQVQNQPVLVCSTGMGGPSTAICLEELARLGIRRVIRVGTTGSIQEDLQLGDVAIFKGAVRLEGTSTHYAPLEFPAVADFDLTQLLVYAARIEKIPCQVGICVSSDTFWPGQERYDSFTGYVIRRFQGSLEEWQALGALCYEMETAALFVTAQALGLQAASLCGVVAKRTESEHIAPPEVYKQAEERFQKVVRRALEELLERK
ncbi:MAG: uridine phosphorylase [Acidaminococcus sp.]|jgi:uridine phosphorylase|nr:uridine phosphorylase [Acidaminococcus sp.]MCI2100489.1 uridine phosphorylase [Acidaminococcus sp.]MCI2114810.1 uridine phosphorylase [Acidaminococcus sp.]MCI2116863.1 uridine phosphorylase [Acidaminococcus sp.]